MSSGTQTITPAGGATQVIGVIIKGVEVVEVLFPIALDLLLKLKGLFAKHGENFQVEIVAFQDGALQAADHTLSIIEAWQKANVK